MTEPLERVVQVFNIEITGKLGQPLGPQDYTRSTTHFLLRYPRIREDLQIHYGVLSIIRTS